MYVTTINIHTLFLGLLFNGAVLETSLGNRNAIDPCEDDSERHLHDMHRRFKNYKTAFQRKHEEMVCDKYLIPQHGAWFMSYNDMPTEPPTFLDCGTTHPIWLNGTIPTISEGVVDRTACKVGFMSYCDEEIPVKIKRCEKYTAYFLLPTKHCPEAYCFGIKKDPPLPKPVVKPSIFIENESSVDRLQFECYMNISTLNFAYYEVTWKWGTSSLTLKNESSQFSNLRLTDEHFKILGVDITCTVKALHFEHDVLGLNATSSKFYAGLKFTEHIITIQKGEVLMVPYNLTIPFSCQMDTCGINVNVIIKEKTELDTCDGQLYAIPRGNDTIDIIQTDWNTTHHIEMKHIGRKGYGVKPSSFSVEIQVDLSKSTFLHYENIPELYVNVQDSDSNRKVCSAYNDPHMTTFDGLSYEHQQAGTYILYEHNILERHMQVQMELTPCNSNVAYCICGLAVRAGGDIFVIYLCGGKTIIKYGTCYDKILKVKRAKRNTKQYKITFPTGTEISANIFLHGGYGGTMNVEVRGSGDDRGQSQGLCGRMTGHTTDNMLIRGTNSTDNTGGKWSKYQIFSDSWRVKDSENLFRWPKDLSIDKWMDFKLNPEESNVLSCDNDNSYEIVQPASCDGNYSLSIPLIVNKTLQTTAPGTHVTFDKEKAQTFCQTQIQQTNAYIECAAGLPGINWKHFYEMCWHDIELTHSTMWAEQTVRAVLERCVVEVKNKDQDESHNTTTVKPIKSPNLDQLCPNDCNNNGTCKDAICTCNQHFLGIDCSVSITKPPIITEIVGLKSGGHTWCDKSKARCNSFRLYGHEIEQSGTLTCKIEKYLATSNSTYTNVSTHIINATVESLSEVRCSLTNGMTPDMRVKHSGLYVEEYLVSLSYNNRNYSHPMILLVFNGRCHDIHHATPNNIVGLVRSTCFINGECIQQGAKDKLNDFVVCNPDSNPLKWTFDSKHNCKINGTFYHHKENNTELQCLSCNPNVSSTNWTLVGKCLIEGDCYTDLANSPFDEMYICNSSYSTTEWSMNHTIPVPDIRIHVSSNMSNSLYKKYELECHLDTSRMNYTYFNITWMWGNNSLVFQDHSNNLLSMRLPGYYITDIGTNVYCIMEGQYELNKVMTTFNSKEFYVGIQTNSPVEIEKGGTAQLRYRLTVPLLCNNCLIHLTIVDTVALGVHNNDGCDGDIVTISQKMDRCDFEIKHTNWNISKTISIKHRPNRQYGVQLDTFLIKLQATVSKTNLTVVEVPDIKVQVIQHDTEWHSKVCSAYTDPHMTTFDGLHYEHQQAGTYTMYRDKQQNMEVQIQLTTCYSDTAFCACGIAIRAGADVFFINFCDGLSVIQYAACEYAPVLHVSKMKRNNQHYRIVFPTGTSVSVKVANINLLDIEIRPSADDFNNTEGLCGTLTNNCSDDFRLRNGNSIMVAASCHNSLYSFANREFSNSWIVSQGDDLFSLSENSFLSVWNNTDNFCKCTPRINGSFSEKCGNHLYPSVYCTDSGFESIETTCRNNVSPGNYIKTIPIKKEKKYETKPANIDKHELTLNESISHCKTHLNNKDVFQLCSEINNIPSQHFEEICAIDVYLSHTYLWTSQTYETLKLRCLQEINLNTTLQTSITKDGKSFTDIRENKLCPGFTKNCNGNGDCTNGTCICNSGYISPDCSVNITTVPTVDYIQNNGLCDTSKGACSTVHVYGHIYEANMIFCKIQTFYMFEDKTFKYGSNKIGGGKITSLIEIECQIPTDLLIERKMTSYISKGYTVNVGYNGSLFKTKTLKYFEFDPKCQIPRGAEEDRFFKIAKGTCFVNGKCYSNMEINPIISFEYCDSHRKQQEWSFNETSVCKIDGKYVPKSNLTSNNECQSCNPEKAVYNWTVVDNECFINYTCYSPNDRNPQNDEEYCDPLNSQISWTFNESVLVPYVRPALLKVHQTIMNVDVERLYFECVMDLNRLFYKFYEVTWTWGRNQSSILESDVNNMQNLWLTESRFHTLGTNISCTLRGKHSYEDQDGTVFTSEPFFAGIQITELMTVQKGGSAELSYNLTVPFGCLSFNNRTLPCFIELNMLSPDYTTSDQCYGDIVNLEHCRVKIWRDTWNTPRTLAIKHRGRQMYGVFPEQISMKLKTSSADHPLWDTTKIPEIKVHVHDNKVELQERVCSAYNVHFTTFDGLHYEQPNQGTFTMYNNRLKERNMMVQAKLIQCDDTNGVHCICGVAVRAGGDVYMFDFCDGNSIIQYMACQQQLLDVTTRSKDNKKYKITFPTGTEVAVYIQYIGTNTFMDVEIRASDSDFNMTEGLCGTLNEKCNDDITGTDGKFLPVNCQSDTIMATISQNFSDSWRVSGRSDLFNLSNGEQIALWTDHDEYCSCPSAEISDEFECSARSTVPCNSKNNYKTIGQSTCKLSSIDNFNIPTKNRIQQNTTTPNPEIVNISLSEAQSRCREAIENNTAFKACSVVPNMPSEYFIQICGMEVQKSKSIAWIRHTVDSMKSRCLSEVQKNETLNDQPSEDIPSITESVILAICPGLPECNGNGKCDHGVCVCNEGFMSQDCSMTKTVPPEIYGVRGNGICDRNEINCDTAFVVGNRIEESDELSCRISKYIIHPDGSKSFEGTTIVSGNVETLVEVHCPLKTPKQKRSVGNTGNIHFVEVFDVSVSYNREDFSDPERVILMNSKCQQINGTTTEPNFVLKDDTCFIDNQCLLDKEPNPQKEYLYCNASAAQFDWTFDDSENCKVDEQYFSRNNIIFDKECLLCNPEITSYNWTLKENYCFIDGVCVPHGEKNTVDECLLCNTGKHFFEWTKQDEVCITKVVKPSDTERSSSKLGLILLGSIGSVVILFIVGFIVNCYVKNNNSRLKKKSTYEADEHYDMRRLPRLKVKT